MNFLHSSRKLKFKAWNIEHQLLMRVHAIDCRKGELIKKNHILLQFTGLCDMDGEEIYDRDVVLITSQKHLVFWHEEQNGWHQAPLHKPNSALPLHTNLAQQMRRLCNLFELEKDKPR